MLPREHASGYVVAARNTRRERSLLQCNERDYHLRGPSHPLILFVEVDYRNTALSYLCLASRRCRFRARSRCSSVQLAWGKEPGIKCQCCFTTITANVLRFGLE